MVVYFILIVVAISVIMGVLFATVVILFFTLQSTDNGCNLQIIQLVYEFMLIILIFFFLNFDLWVSKLAV